ncbi:MAG TPA: DUF4856 domain-containing protein [Cytophagaceae bacterium]|nr:DUF4856 domain-containing protein [Cytophagaceae bacterium]
MTTINKVFTGLLALALIFSAGCKKKKDVVTPVNSYDVPTSYSGFSNVEYSEATTRLNMFKTIENQMKKGVPATGTYTLDGTALKNMFSNSSSPFTDSTQWNGISIQLEDHVDPNAHTLIEGYLDTYAQSSASTTPADFGTGGTVGTAGIATGNATNGSKRTLFDAHGINHAQAFQKTMFGAFLVYQIDNILANIANQDNSANVSGQSYTAQEHAWDLAFGYAGFSKKYTVDSLTNTTFIAAHKSLYFYIANYSTQVDAGIHSSTALLNAFLKGRAAISNKDDATRDAQATLIIAELEKFLAACVIHEINELMTGNATVKFPDAPSKCSSLSESMGFLIAMKYNPRKVTISDTQIDDVLSHYHATTNLNDVSLSDVSYIKNTISSIYGLDSLKDII